MNAAPTSAPDRRERPGPPVPSVLLVVLTWNGRDDTLACIASILALDYPRFQVLVVDNASEDGTEAALRAQFGARIDIRRNATNLLYAGGMNVGLEHARAIGADYVLLLNNDIVVDPGLLGALVEGASADPRIAAAGPKIYYHAEPERIWFAGGELSLWRGWPHHRGLREWDRGQHDRPEDVDYLTGCALLVRTSALPTVGLLDPGYAMYAEDADWSLRARRAGFRLRYVPQARMWHKVSASAGARSWFKMRRRLRSEMRLLRRHARWYHWLTIPFGTGAEMVRVGVGLLGRRR